MGHQQKEKKMKEKSELIYGSSYNTEVKINNRQQPNQQARMALALVERWGMVAGMPDGEDSTGRAKLRLSTPEELADRAVAASYAIYNKIEANDWFIMIPDLETIIENNRKAQDRN